MERENLEAGEDVVQSSETVGPNLVKVSVKQRNKERN